jgi:hypothetical protein
VALAKRMKMGLMSSMHYYCSYGKNRRARLRVKIEEKTRETARTTSTHWTCRVGWI